MEICMFGSFADGRVINDVQVVALPSSDARLSRLVGQGELGVEVGIALDQRRWKNFSEDFLERLPINPESLVVVALPDRKGDQADAAAPRQSRIRSGVIEWRLLMAVIMLRAALEK